MYDSRRILDCILAHDSNSKNAIASGWMDSWHKRRLEAGWRGLRVAQIVTGAARGGLLLGLLAECASLMGCASPGPPLPPSLKLPEVVQASTLTATRVGDQVRLHWTTPSRTTDKLLIVGPVTAEICREPAAGGPAVGTKLAAATVTAPCAPVIARVQVTPGGASEAVDTLPASLASGPAHLLAYQVQLRNAAGRTAGASLPVFAASGPVPPPVEDLSGTATKAGAVLEWKKLVSGDREGGTNGVEGVEVERSTLEPVAGESATSGSGRSAGSLGAPKQPAEAKFRVEMAEGVDSGGTVDRSTQIGHTYRYTVQRVRTVVADGQTLEVRSLPSVTVTVQIRDVFPPEAPAGLVAAPAGAGEGVENPTSQNRDVGHPAIDLSWEPNMEPRMAGYRVYRRDLDGGAPDAWVRLGAELVPAAAYRDLSVVAGHRYAYRVTAVSEAGNESAPSSEVVETAPAH